MCNDWNECLQTDLNLSDVYLRRISYLGKRYDQIVYAANPESCVSIERGFIS